MKTLKIKTLLLFIAIISLSCGDYDQITLLNNGANNTDGGEIFYNRWDDSGKVAPRYDGSDGGPIDNAVANSWIRNFNKRARLVAPTTHYFTRQTIEHILKQPGCTGIRIYYALGNTGELKLVISGVDENGYNILSETPVLAATQSNVNGTPTGGIIAYQTARTWIESYQITIDPSEIKSHYFGRIGIDVVLAQAGCAGLHIYHAMNDSNELKLLIVGTTTDSANVVGGGRTKEDGLDLPIKLNFSFPCPSTCGNGGNGGL